MPKHTHTTKEMMDINAAVAYSVQKFGKAYQLLARGKNMKTLTVTSTYYRLPENHDELFKLLSDEKKKTIQEVIKLIEEMTSDYSTGERELLFKKSDLITALEQLQKGKK